MESLNFTDRAEAARDDARLVNNRGIRWEPFGHDVLDQGSDRVRFDQENRAGAPRPSIWHKCAKNHRMIFQKQARG